MLHHARMMLGRAGAAPVLDTQTVTSGASGTSGAGTRKRGFITGAIGSISDGTSNLYGGAAIRTLASLEIGPGEGFDVVLEITGTVSNSGWTTMKVGSHLLDRNFAIYTNPGGNSKWTWENAGELFGTSGTTAVQFS